MLRFRPALTYPVNEVFVTVQGEAAFTGTPAVFIRFQGCPVGCAFCDTKHTWALDDDQQTGSATVLGKGDEPSATWARMTVEELCEAVRLLAGGGAERVSHVVLTGGEPAMYDLRPLCIALEAQGYTVQIETSGTFELKVTPTTFVTVSPKIGQAGGLAVLLPVIRRADEVKHVASNERHVHELEELLREAGNPHVPIWLQPLAPHKGAPGFCTRVVIDRGWRLSVQTHKAAGIR